MGQFLTIVYVIDDQIQPQVGYEANMRELAILVTGLFMVGCAGQFDLTPPRYVVARTAAVKEPEGRTNKADEKSTASVQLNEACARKRYEILTAQAKASDSTTKAKTVAGLLTAGVGTIGGGTTAAVRENADATLVLGLVTLGLSIAGGITTAVLAPGDSEIAVQNAKLVEISQAIEKYNTTCEANPDATQCHSLLGAALGVYTDGK